MNKKVIATTILMGSLLAGCAGRQPLTFSGDITFIPPDQVKSAFVHAAMQNGWSICEVAPNQLRADLAYKRDRVYADITIQNNRYEIKPNLKYSSLVNEDGTVHRSINNYVKRLNNLALQKMMHPTQANLKPTKLARCVNYDSVAQRITGVAESRMMSAIVPQGYVNTAFGWLSEPVVLAKTTKFDFNVSAISDVPPEIVDSMNLRMKQFLAKSGNFGLNESPYLLEIQFYKYEDTSVNDVSDYMALTDAYRMLYARTILKEKAGRPICVIDSSVRVNSSGFTGIITKATNRVTADIASTIIQTIEDKLMNPTSKTSEP